MFWKTVPVSDRERRTVGSWVVKPPGFLRIWEIFEGIGKVAWAKREKRGRKDLERALIAT